MDKVGKFFNPEFINRLDETVIFNKISRENIPDIFKIEFEKANKRIEKIGYNTNITDSAIKFLCEKGYDDKYGARPMARTVQNYIETPLASEILSESLNSENIVYIDHDEISDSLTFSNIKK